MNMTFWKTFWASLLASVVSGILITGIFLVILNAMVSSFNSIFEEKRLVVKENTVLHMTLDSNLGDYSHAYFDESTLQIYSQLGVHDILKGLEYAAEDDKIEGIFLNCDGVPTGLANVKEIRDGLVEFQKSGKFVVAYHENYTTKAYYLASAAEEVYVFPTGLMEFLGLGAERMFFKGALEKLDLEMQIIRGSNNKFKSAVEPLMYEQMSEASREQSMKYLNAMWDQMLTDIAKSRNMKKSRLNEIADSVYIRKSGDAVDYKMADGVLYYDQVLDTLRERVGLEEDAEVTLLSFKKYTQKKVKQNYNLRKKDKKNMAVIFAEGEIVDGQGEPNQIGGAKLSKQIREARLDEDIKGVVLRINSPGGSALASDVVWREVKETKKVKPIVVSMGTVAASGGYYIACAADKIYAQPNTITGSIGVFGIIPYTGDLFKNHLGITFDRVQTNDHAVLSTNKRLDEQEIQIIQEEIDDIYDDFISKVAKGRGMKKSEVDSIGQGRVWAGTDAINIGLVDEFGGLDDAIEDVRKRAGIEEDSVMIRYYPSQEPDPVVELLANMSESENSASMRTTAMSELETKFYDIYGYIKTIGDKKSIQARMPYLLWIE